MLEVVEPGLLLTFQDAGRLGHAGLGIPPSGACDAWGLAVANLLAGAPPGAVALEVTFGGAELVAREPCVVALGGADLGAERDDGAPLRVEATHGLVAGARIRFTGPRRGVRGYLALAGGIDAPLVLGSGSTLVGAGLGGLDGRPLQAGDVVTPVRPGDLSAAGRAWPAGSAPHPGLADGPLRFVAGPDADRLPTRTVERLAEETWTVAVASDRMGVRLEGPSLEAGDEILSHPLVPGAIQLPPAGRPVVLLVDGPTIGGYPVPATVCRADLPRLGQLRPGDAVRFAPIDVEAARALWREQRARFAAAASTLGGDDLWERLIAGAGG